MIERAAASTLPADSYSPELRTGVVFAGTGTAGAYHAGVLRALHEAAVKIDVVGGRGGGVIAALFAAIDGGARLWDEKGFWRAAAVQSFYRWQRVLRLGAWTLLAAVAIVLAPLAAIALGLVVFPIDFALRMVGIGGASGLVGWYVGVVQAAFAPEALPTWVPRLVVVALTAFAVVAAITGVRSSSRRRAHGAWWWRLVPPPLSSSEAIDHVWHVMWDLVRGAAPLKQPSAPELARRYGELLAENLGQPGIRELLLTVHDIDARRDIVFALVGEPLRRDLIRRPTAAAGDARRAEVFDLHGVGREYLADAVAGALSIPLATASHPLPFAADSYWRGETHRLCDRPAALGRLLEELAAVGVEQAIIVSAAAASPGPHALSMPRLNGRGRIGEHVQSSETAALRDAIAGAAARPPRLFTITPEHNPVGPLDFDGGYDDRSDRRQSLTELMSRGYEDAYRQFIEPIVGASGERVGQGVA